MRPPRSSSYAGFAALLLILLVGASKESIRQDLAERFSGEAGLVDRVRRADDPQPSGAPAHDRPIPVPVASPSGPTDLAPAIPGEAFPDTPVQAPSATIAEAPDGDASDPDVSAAKTRSAGPAIPSTSATRGEVTEPDTRRRRYRRRYRNRYPGPIPTPADWQPPEGPVKIALQAGHWRAHEAPPELSGLRDNGTRWEDVSEWQANLEVARRTASLLEASGYEVEILPAVVPPGYRAHLFVSIHADGSVDPRASGYRVASPRRDATGRAGGIAALLERSYGESTGLRHITTSTRRMRNYYAFNFRRYEHALHPMTIAVILETGFLTSPLDRGIILDDPDRAARGIVEAIQAFPVTALPLVADEDDSDGTPAEATGTDGTQDGMTTGDDRAAAAETGRDAAASGSGVREPTGTSAPGGAAEAEDTGPGGS